MRSYNGFVTVIEASNSMADRLVGMVKPRPPSLGGKDKSSRSRSPGGALPVIRLYKNCAGLVPDLPQYAKVGLSYGQIVLPFIHFSPQG